MTPMQQIVPKAHVPYLPLHAWRSPEGDVVTRWHLTWRERLRLLFGGTLWLTVLTFNRPLQPVKLDTTCPIPSKIVEIDRDQTKFSGG
jgi:hypothetical protein